ncbi:ATP11 [Nannizzia gypsea CBS 118893]|uniref:ATP11 n=1 Tax=Arthroderma gypseum (strain ATCC MYA-4604 / CBS 118893) TaxID=535722 RepID=E4UVK7_ARTGP|nr:ATP11 [Nannizzia gypsea CBS 118893]EFR02334.1 ATP11 [Nannizzia gypsea CBS 118893]
MASIRIPAIRNLLCRPILPARHVQRRWAQVHDARFITTHQSSQVLDKYKDKLARKAKEEGHDSVTSLKEAYKEKIQEVRSADAAPQTPPTTPSSSPSEPAGLEKKAAEAKAKKTSSSAPGIKPLSSYLDLEKTAALPPDMIGKLWRARHVTNPNSICASIPIETYNRMASVARQNPQFILPLPRELETPSDPNAESSSETAAEKAIGAEMHFLQWGFHPPASASDSKVPTPLNTHNTHTSTVIFTSLAEYKLHAGFAPPHTVITHHLDFADDKGIVLMNGTVVTDRGMTVDDAQLLVLWLQKFYDWEAEGAGSQGGRKGEMLRMFTSGDTEGFKVQELIDEVQRV